MDLFYFIYSGGTSITVRGDGLNLIQKPEFVTTYGGQFFREVCTVFDVVIFVYLSEIVDCIISVLVSALIVCGKQC